MRFLAVIGFLVLTINLFGQEKQIPGANNVAVKQMVSKIEVDDHFIDTFSFTRRWDYATGIFKDDSTGEFSTDGSPLDTTHFFFTANCTTNVQGGYPIRYCFATKNTDKITLSFSDGLPAYASKFYVYLKGLHFSCNVETIYPVSAVGQKKYCTISKQRLILDKSKYMKGDTIKGYIEIEFVETVELPNRQPQKKDLFMKGHFKTKAR